MENMELRFLLGKRVFITGHTGFKGAWLCSMLLESGARVIGYALDPPTCPSLFDILKLNDKIDGTFGDIRDFDALWKCFKQAAPEYVIHMAAQPLVSVGYAQPSYTYAVNVIGTVNILECVRRSNSVKAFLNITTDKVYYSKECESGYQETDILDGFDPYSNSKSCSELVTRCYARSFVMPSVFTARAGNVIGGGDFSQDRIIPDCFRRLMAGMPISIRSPQSVRPYQHVLDCLYAYLLLLKNPEKAGHYNIGSGALTNINTVRLVDLFCQKWGSGTYQIIQGENKYHEVTLLKLDTSRMQSVFKWSPCWDIETVVMKTADWYKSYAAGEDVISLSHLQIRDMLYNQLKTQTIQQ